MQRRIQSIKRGKTWYLWHIAMLIGKYSICRFAIREVSGTYWENISLVGKMIVLDKLPTTELYL